MTKRVKWSVTAAIVLMIAGMIAYPQIKSRMKASKDAAEVVPPAGSQVRKQVLNINAEVLKYQYKGKNIAEVMDMTVRQAIQFFEDADFVKKLDTLVQVGLGYLHLNQSMTTLSGGELQRVKLASKLDERGQIFILDEPTDGLHLDDIRRLMKLFNRMTDQGNTLFIIEHSLDVMKDADYIVELGPGGGLAGGSLLFAGTPKEMLEAERSVTREYLRESL
jgi:excinuclease UvrABC ATPase subunit